jgi:hypothetical protein
VSASDLEAVAEVLEQAARSLRLRAAQLGTSSEPGPATERETSAVERLRTLHPAAGPRQIEVVQVLDEAGAEGTNTGVIARRIDYDQPNVYLTLQGLTNRGFVVKDESTTPHTYRLATDLFS